jgi:hypothetical protein
MSRLTVTRSSRAPGRFILCQVWGCPGNWQWDDSDSERSSLVEESDITITASLFGWVSCAQCRETDGTVDCAHRTTAEMLQDATDYLDGECVGMVVEDPGIFCNLPEGF